MYLNSHFFSTYMYHFENIPISNFRWTFKKEKDEILKAILDNLELLKTEDKKGTVYDIHKVCWCTRNYQ